MIQPAMNADDGIDLEIEELAWAAALPNAEDLVRRAAAAALAGRRGGAVTILLTNDAVVRDLNARFRRADAPTNVLAFPAGANPEDLLGDVALAYGVCAQEALAQDKTLADHLRHLVIHGVLHLLGYDHQDDAEAKAMEARERALLAGLGVADPYASESPANDRPGDAAHVATPAIDHG